MWPIQQRWRKQMDQIQSTRCRILLFKLRLHIQNDVRRSLSPAAKGILTWGWRRPLLVIIRESRATTLRIRMRLGCRNWCFKTQSLRARPLGQAAHIDSSDYLTLAAGTISAWGSLCILFYQIEIVLKIKRIPGVFGLAAIVVLLYIMGQQFDKLSILFFYLLNRLVLPLLYRFQVFHLACDTLYYLHKQGLLIF